MAEKKTPITLPSLVRDDIYLRPSTPEDIRNSYHWYVLSDPQLISPYARMSRTAKEAAEAFEKKAGSVSRERYTIIRRKDKSIVGWISYFHLNRHNRSAGLEIVIDPDERRNGLAARAIEILCCYLFRNRGLNKVIFQVAEPNDVAIGLLEKLGMKRDGTLRRHYFIDGEYRDGFIYTMLSHESPW